jgi:hypothetical protein
MIGVLTALLYKLLAREGIAHLEVVGSSQVGNQAAFSTDDAYCTGASGG